MKYQLQILLSVLLCMVGKVDASSLYDYGLSLKSHAVPGIERTTLYLDDNQPFSIKTILSFHFKCMYAPMSMTLAPFSICIQTPTNLFVSHLWQVKKDIFRHWYSMRESST